MLSRVRTVSSIKSMQTLALKWRRENIKIGLVPTMGYLHAGHVSLAHAARKIVGPAGRVVVSVFVNPTQFGPQEDWGKYPRDFPRDARLCREAGVDVIFAPSAEGMYPRDPDAGFSTSVVEEQLSRSMEGVARPTHFRGVTTVVAKLFNLVLPDVAVFGAKDFQQAAVIRRMTRDLNFPVRLVVAPTLREKDGLAMSSRNKYLQGEQREQARGLSQALARARQRVAAEGAVPAGRLRQTVAAALGKLPAAKLDYVEFFDPRTLEPARVVRPGTQMALAVYIGKTRLIDNATL